MANDLISPDDLSGFPGAPFTDGVVDAAVANLRSHAGWHIAPSREETMSLDSHGGNRLVLPTLHLTAVAEVRNVSSETPTEVTGFRWSKAGILSYCRWPCGFQTVEADVTHGHAECPPELLAALAAESEAVAISRAVASRSIGPFSESYRDSSVTGGSVYASDAAVARYTLPSRP